MPSYLPIIRPNLSFDDVADSLRSIVESGILTGGETVTAFEQAVAAYVDAEHAVATTSATTALHLSLAALDLGPGDEVVMSDFTFPATANVVVQTGATPVFADSSPTGFAVDPELLGASVTPQTKAIVPVDPFGQPADHAEIEKIGADLGVPIVVDAACSLGAERDERRCGAHGTIGCFSFHPRKVVTCGEGGMATTDDAGLADRMRRLRAHGGERSKDGISFVESGFNYRMTELQAAFGLAQMNRIDEILNDRAATAYRYDQLLGAHPKLRVPQPAGGAVWSYQSYVVLLQDPDRRDAVIDSMAQRGIETTIGTYACHTQPAFARYGYAPGDLPNSAGHQAASLTLPLLPHMTAEDVGRVVTGLNEVLGS